MSRFAALGLSLLLASCAEPHYHSGALKCSLVGRACPDHFQCALDGRCYQDGALPDLSTAMMNPSDLGGADLAGAPPRDLSAAVDLARADLATHDMATHASLCAGLGVKLCDGFESATLDARWTNDINNGSITVDTSRAYRGASSLHLHTNAEPTPSAEPQANVAATAALPIATTIYLRVWAYFPSGTPATFDQLLNFTDSSNGNGISFSAADGHPIINDYGGSTSAYQFNESSLFSIPTDQWTCLQMQIPQSAATGIIKIFVDGAEITDDTTNSGANTPPIDRMYLGLDWYQNPANLPATDIWLDEIIVDDQPTSCAE